jgi:hypothetical protein
MTPQDLVAAFERGLQLHAHPFDRRSLLAFVESAWARIEEDAMEQVHVRLLTPYTLPDAGRQGSAGQT